MKKDNDMEFPANKKTNKKFVAALIAIFCSTAVICAGIILYSYSDKQLDNNTINAQNSASGKNEHINEENVSSTKKANNIIDENLLTVDITIPSDFFSPEDPATSELTDEQKSNGYISAKLNEDGSVTYKMKKSSYNKQIKAMKADMKKEIEATVTSGNTPSFKEIEVNDTFTKMTISVNRQQFENSMDGMSILGLYFGISLYQTFANIDPECVITIKDIDTNENIDVYHYPNEFSNAE